MFLNILILVVLIYLISLSQSESYQNPQTNLGYHPEDKKKLEALSEATNQKYPCYQKYRLQGYDNPYIYPYNYQMNLNHPASKFEFPEWVREISKSKNDTFPGFSY